MAGINSQFDRTTSGFTVTVGTAYELAGFIAAGASSFSLTLNVSSESAVDPSLPRTSRRLAAVWLAKRRRA